MEIGEDHVNTSEPLRMNPTIGIAVGRDRSPVRVKRRNTRGEQMFSALPPESGHPRRAGMSVQWLGLELFSWGVLRNAVLEW
jgi:hypothetical protein